MDGATPSRPSINSMNQRRAAKASKALRERRARRLASPRPCQTPCHRTAVKGRPLRREAVRGSLGAAADGLGLLGGGHCPRGLRREPRVPPQSLEVAVSLERCVVAGRETAEGEAAAVSERPLADEEELVLLSTPHRQQHRRRRTPPAGRLEPLYVADPK